MPIPLPVRDRLQGLRARQNSLFLWAAGISIVGSFAGIIAKGWLIHHLTHQPMLLAVNFACLTLPALFLSQHAGLLTDQVGAEPILKRAQYFLLGGSVVSAAGFAALRPWPPLSVAMLILGTLIIGCASSYELTARTKYASLLVPEPEVGAFLASFSVVFNVAKLVGPPIGGFVLTWLSPELSLTLDSLSYLVPIAVVNGLMTPKRLPQLDGAARRRLTLGRAWRQVSGTVRRSILFTGLASLIGFCHPALVPIMAAQYIGPDPLSLGWFTAAIAVGSIVSGLLLKRHSVWVVQHPVRLLGSASLITGLAQLLLTGLPLLTAWGIPGVPYLGAILIGFGTAALLAGSNIITQARSPLETRGRIAALNQIASLGGGGLSSLMAGALVSRLGLQTSLGLLGAAGVTVALLYLSSGPGRSEHLE